MISPRPIIAVLAGGTSAEREVSLGSGRASALALARTFPTQLFEVNANALPAGLDPTRHVVFSALHGTFGEDGGMQELLDRAGIHYAGCGAGASWVTMQKSVAKDRVSTWGVGVAPGVMVRPEEPPTLEQVVRIAGERVVLKPEDEGSSVGLALLNGRAEIEAALRRIRSGTWLMEKRIDGRELSVGILQGRALGIVEIRPRSGVYDFTSKYTKGLTEYLAPAPLDERTTLVVKAAAEAAFAACGCRDYARVDFILPGEGDPCMLEINTLPGMKETSLLPMSARCEGLDFTALVRELVQPAIDRFLAATGEGAAAAR